MMAPYHPLGFLFLILFLLSNCLIANYAQLEDSAEPEVTILQGTVLGTTMTTRHGRNISAFLGIPYGQSPVGNLRFASPVAANGWSGTLDATTDPSKCAQLEQGVVVGEEDCLFVKVYTPELPKDTTNSSLLPVMVYIHGGGFAAESPDHNGPEYLLDADVVLVVMNYRLGPLGFLSTGDAVASGNWGLKDQILALHWVQDNIQYFGGDPDQVTIFGESAGAASVYHLASSNATVGLFHKCITQSGSSLTDWGKIPRATSVSHAFELGEFVGCSSTTSDLLISCLRTIEFPDLVASQLDNIVWDSLIINVWGPTDEPDVEGAILTDIPSNLFAAGAVRDVPWVTGIVRDEALMHTAVFYEDKELLNDFLENIDTILPIMLRWPDQQDLWASRLSAAKSFYFNNDLTINTSLLIENLTLLINDCKFYYPIYNSLQQQHALAVNPLYFYTFNYRGTYSYTYMDVGYAASYGVRHADDLIYLFSKDSVFSHFNKTMSETDYEMVDTMVQLWTSFAITGTPTAPVSESVTWEPYSLDDNYLRIGNEYDVGLELQYSFFKERMEFWANIDAVVDTEDDSESIAEPEVTIPQGNVLGTIMTTRYGRNISAFLGIPYGQPPIGKLRFANPVAANAWNGTLDATTDPSKCPQTKWGVVVGEEDCLFVKVYTPELPKDTTTSLLPVMVYIHGGGFGAEDPDHNGPEYLLDADVVLVVMNYRLGVLGFLSTGDEVASGNWGLKDQILALRWVQGNIRYFGGDPDQVTIFGESAGAVSVYHLASSSTTVGLFHKCITQSGSSLASWGNSPRATYLNHAYELGEFFGCLNTTSDLLISCLQAVEFSDIVASHSHSESLAMISWGPTNEPDVEGAILTDIPSNLFAAGAVRDVPWITGVVRDEGLMFTAGLYDDEEKLNDFLENIDTRLLSMLGWTDQTDLSSSRLSAVKSFYFNNDLTVNTTLLLNNLTLIIDDSMFYYPIYNSLQQQHAVAVNPLYLYTFNYRGTYSYTYMDVGYAASYGVRHADDLVYLFSKDSVFSEYNKTMSETDYVMVDTMVQLWTSFAITGTPTAPVSESVKWEPYSLDDNYLRIGNEYDVGLELQYSFFKERMEFWANINAVVDTEDDSDYTIIGETNNAMAPYDSPGYLLSTENTAEPEVMIPQGTVLGTIMTTRHGRNISAFLGIPYGQPPIGKLRFANPVAANAWNGTLDATTDPSKCGQLKSGVVVGEEDCLFVKVYTPELPNASTSSLLPVMVYIHGGGFDAEDPDHNGPEYLLDADVVLVVMNYRLGVLGFLSTGDEVASGNWGLKDQILALRWVQDNIRYFGGDPDQVTIFGESAGAASVYHLASSSTTVGLFHKCITQSGSSLALWGNRPVATYLNHAYALGEFFGCLNTTSDLLISCLQAVEFSDILASRLHSESLSIISWGPTNEPDVEGAILTDIPSNLFAAGAVRDVPWITGVVRDEGLLLTAVLYDDEEKLNAFFENIDTGLLSMLSWPDQTDLSPSQLSAVKSFYFNNDLTMNTTLLLDNLTLIIDDNMFYYPIYNALQQQHALAVNPLYFYTFNYRGTYSYTYMDVGYAASYGVRHADDLVYLFSKDSVFSEYNKTMSETDYEMVDTMVQLWTSFAITGTPTAPVSESVTWEPYSLDDNYLRIGNEYDVGLELQYSFFKERMAFWANINAVVDTEDDSENTAGPEVTIPQGTVLGTIMTTRHGRNISAFLGIPYAQPPTGNLRFASPVALDSWNGTLNATIDPSKCLQVTSDEVVGDEDCLFVKVYTPELFQNTTTLSLLPVMVFIHGGGFIDERPDRNGPGYLLDADVVLVVVNYRLGPLGFLSTGDEFASGNWGLKDQVLALKWVQNNIRYFGGDPDQVTLFGESAGAASVYHLAASNTTIGLFHRCITQSGSSLASWGYRPRADYVRRAFELGEFVGCSNTTSDSLINCLRGIDSWNITATQFKYVVWESLSLGVWGPTDEPDIEGAILTDIPSNLLTAGAVRDLPWITGVTRDEALLHTAALYADEELLNEFIEDIDFLLPTMLRWTYQKDFWVSRLSAAKSYYFNNDLSMNTNLFLQNLTLLIEDSKFFYPVYNALQHQLSRAVNPLYFYTLNYRGTYSFTYTDVGAAVSYGVRHADDLIYLFPKEDVFSEYNKTMIDTDYEMVDTMVQLWTSFAITGTPTASALESAGITWEPYSSNDNYLRIGNEFDVGLELQYSFFKERMEFWANIDNPVVDTDDDSGTVTSSPNLLFLLLVVCSKLILSSVIADRLG